MGRRAQNVQCDDQTRAELERISKSLSAEVRLVRRARMVLGCLDGKRIIDIASELGEHEVVIIESSGATDLWHMGSPGCLIARGQASRQLTMTSGKPWY